MGAFKIVASCILICEDSDDDVDRIEKRIDEKIHKGFEFNVYSKKSNQGIFYIGLLKIYS